MAHMLLEVCCGSAADAVAAHAGGADRIELNSCLYLGGLTPSAGTLRTVKVHCPGLPVICMLRPRSGGFCYDSCEFETMLADAEALLESGADGFAFGILTPDGTIDVERCRSVLEKIGSKQSVFHRAFDVTADLSASLEVLISLGFTRVLTSGGKATAPEGADVIRSLQLQAAGRIELLPGSGIRAENAAELLRVTGVSQLHSSCGSRLEPERSACRNPAVSFLGSLPPEDSFTVTDEAAVAALRRFL